MSYTVKYGVDLKAIRPMYPDAENAKPVLDNVIKQVKTIYGELRTQELKNHEQHRIHNLTHNLPTDNIPTSTIGEYDTVITASYEVIQGTTYNEVVTMDAIITFETDDAEAVKLLGKIDINGTFFIEPTYRVTGY